MYGVTTINGKTIKHDPQLYLGYDHPLKRSLYGMLDVEEFTYKLLGLSTKVYVVNIHLSTPNTLNQTKLRCTFYDKDLMDKKIIECVQEFFGTLYAFRKKENVL